MLHCTCVENVNTITRLQTHGCLGRLSETPHHSIVQKAGSDKQGARVNPPGTGSFNNHQPNPVYFSCIMKHTYTNRNIKALFIDCQSPGRLSGEGIKCMFGRPHIWAGLQLSCSPSKGSKASSLLYRLIPQWGNSNVRGGCFDELLMKAPMLIRTKHFLITP